MKKKRLTETKNVWLEWDSNYWPEATGYNGYLQLRLLHTPIDEQWILYTCKNKLCDPQRHSFHFERVLFQSMQRLLSC